LELAGDDEVTKTYRPSGPYGIVIEQGGIVRKIRKLVYRLGFRPKMGSVFYSPSLAIFYVHKDGMKKR